MGQENFYLSTARLDPLKRVGSIIKAFKKLTDKKLLVVSDGIEKTRLKKLAANSPNISILGRVDEAKLLRLIGTCIATIYVPDDEDFGMSPIESMAAGKPVIGVSQGGILETVIPGQTGILISPDANPYDIASAVMELDSAKARTMRIFCEKRASEFGLDIFIKKIKRTMQ